ncbi:hypothetical protein [Amycolatopsis sp. NPDC059657]|uniref:hypothetical protein n=1 Tax=Amycolatopsis sp. NPDC059657 TaxID=3346899 RepID=UPI00366A9CF8
MCGLFERGLVAGPQVVNRGRVVGDVAQHLGGAAVGGLRDTVCVGGECASPCGFQDSGLEPRGERGRGGLAVGLADPPA